MIADHISVSSSPWSDERTNGHTVDFNYTWRERKPNSLELQEFDHLQEFESAVLEQLPEMGESVLLAVSWTLSAATRTEISGSDLEHLARLQLFYSHVESVH